jgi:hypothetical protein
MGNWQERLKRVEELEMVRKQELNYRFERARRERKRKIEDTLAKEIERWDPQTILEEIRQEVWREGKIREILKDECVAGFELVSDPIDIIQVTRQPRTITRVSHQTIGGGYSIKGHPFSDSVYDFKEAAVKSVEVCLGIFFDINPDVKSRQYRGSEGEGYCSSVASLISGPWITSECAATPEEEVKGLMMTHERSKEHKNLFHFEDKTTIVRPIINGMKNGIINPDALSKPIVDLIGGRSVPGYSRKTYGGWQEVCSEDKSMIKHTLPSEVRRIAEKSLSLMPTEFQKLRVGRTKDFSQWLR